MQIKETYIAAFLVLLGWLASGIWFVSNMNAQIDGLKQDLTRIERQCENLNDKMYWYLSGNVGPIKER